MLNVIWLKTITLTNIYIYIYIYIYMLRRQHIEST